VTGERSDVAIAGLPGVVLNPELLRCAFHETRARVKAPAPNTVIARSAATKRSLIAWCAQSEIASLRSQ
jgi:hypothetical protein